MPIRRRRGALLALASLALAGLAGTAHAAAVCGYVPRLDVRDEPARVPADSRLLDAAVGDYRLYAYDLDDVMTVTRDGDRLLVGLVGRAPAPFEPIGPALFVDGAFGDRLELRTDGKGAVTGLIWRRRHMAQIGLPRIGGARAATLKARFARRLDAAGQPHSREALLRLIDGLQSGKPDYGAMSIYLNIATRRQLPRLRPFLNDLGPVQSVRFLGFMGQGINGVDGETYDVVHKDGVSRWRIAVDAMGVIAGATVGCGP
jgi:ABC-type amino acid transport substrate-binding protein